jgi:hypothetical protein
MKIYYANSKIKIKWFFLLFFHDSYTHFKVYLSLNKRDLKYFKKKTNKNPDKFQILKLILHDGNHKIKANEILYQNSHDLK